MVSKHWIKGFQAKTVYGFEINSFRNSVHGLRVMHVDVPGPTVSGYFALATEAHDHDGNPHVLEHLVFLGSKSYPFKGVLDCVANRSLAQGTNAWTDTDHTCYTIQTAGEEGFLQVLPVFLDHILFPTITEAGFHTEVHHINGQGEDAGVVYSEMQGRENSSSDILHFNLLKRLYPENCGYTSETGGKLENLRNLSVDKVRGYHRSCYKSENLVVIIVGHLSNYESLFQSLSTIDMELDSASRFSSPRPWSANPEVFPLIEKSLTESILFPEEDESIGTYIIGWHGPKITDHLERTALQMLFSYLSDSPIAPLQKALVEIENPFSTDVDFSFLEFSTMSFFCELANVPTDLESETLKEFFFTLKNHQIDMKRMKVVLEREILSDLEQMETNPHHAAGIPLITDFLYGSDGWKDTLEFLDFQKHALYLLEHWKFDDWNMLLKKWILDANHVALFGKPSKLFADKLAEEEKTRTSKQAKDLGDSGLSSLDQKLTECKKINEIPVPDEMLRKFKIPSVNSISFHEVTMHSFASFVHQPQRVELLEQLKKYSPACKALFLNEISSEFVEFNLYFNTEGLKPEERLMIPCVLESLFQVPLLDPDSGNILSHEEVVNGLQEDSVSFDSYVGFDGSSSFRCGEFSKFIIVCMKVSKIKYEKGLLWLRNVIWNSRIDEERISVSCSKLLNEIPELKRDGMSVARNAMNNLNFNEKISNHISCSFTSQQDFLKSTLKKLKSKAGKSIILDQFRKLSMSLFRPEQMIIQVSGPSEIISKHLDLWSMFKPQGAISDVFLGDYSFPKSSEERTEISINPRGVALMHELKSVESTCGVFCTNGPSDFQDQDIAAILVLHEYLSTMEGPFWKEIRGQGLAYSCHIYCSVEQGLLYFVVSSSPDVFDAFQAASKIVCKFVEKGESSISETFLESTKSSVIYNIIAKEETPSQAAFQVFASQVFRNRDNRVLMKQIEKVGSADLMRVLVKYTSKVFDPKFSNCSIVTSPNKSKDLNQKFQDFGYKLKIEKLK